jgi:HK97 family phage prohead protease
MPDANLDDMDFKAAPAGQVSVNKSKGIVEAFVAGIGNKDSVGDICASGAFNGSLKRRKPRVVWGHNWNDPIGKVLEIYEVPASDPRLPAKMKAAGIGGLYAKVQFNLNSEKGREAFANVQFFGLEQEWSIGYKTLDAVFDPSKQANVLKEVELYEVSPVLHGANQLTGTISIKSAKKPKKDPKGGLTAAGRAHYNRTEGANLKPGVRGAADTPQKMRRKGSFLTRFFTNPSGPMKKPNGKPTRLALSAAAWGEPVPQNRSDAAKLAAKGRRLLERYENSKKKKDAQWDEIIDDWSEIESLFEAEFAEIKSDNEWWGIEDIHEFEEKGHGWQPPARREDNPSREPIFAEGEAQAISPEKRNALEMEIASRVPAPIKVISATENIVIFAKKTNDGGKKFYRLPYHWDRETSQYMFGKPERVMPQMSWQPMNPRNVVVPSQMPSMPMRVTSNTTSRAYARDEYEPSMADVYQSRPKDDEKDALDEMMELLDIDMGDIESKEDPMRVVIECPPENAFAVKSALDPIIEYHDVQAEVTEEGITFPYGATDEFLDALHVATQNLDTLLGGGSKKALRSLRGLTARFDPNAIDGDEDGLVQEGTPFERPATPGVGQAVDAIQDGMRASRMRGPSYFERMSPQEKKQEVNDAIARVQEAVEDAVQFTGSRKNFDALSMIQSLADDGQLDAIGISKADAVRIMGQKGMVDKKDIDTLAQLVETDRWRNRYAQIQDNADAVDDLVSEYSRMVDSRERIMDEIERLDDEAEGIEEDLRNMAQFLKMDAEEFAERFKGEGGRERAEQFIRDNFDAEEIESGDPARDFDEALGMLARGMDIQDDIKRMREDLEDLEENVIGDEGLQKWFADGEFMQRVYKSPLEAGDRKAMQKARETLEAETPQRKPKKASGQDISVGMGFRSVRKLAEDLLDFAEEQTGMSDGAREVLDAVVESLMDPKGPRISLGNLDRVIGAVASQLREDDPVTNALEILRDIKQKAKNGKYNPTRFRPNAQQINDVGGMRSRVSVPDGGLTIRLNDDERGDLRRALEKAGDAVTDIQPFAELDSWLAGSSDKLSKDQADRIMDAFGELAKNADDSGPIGMLANAKRVMDFAALDPKGTYESPRLKKGGGFANSVAMPSGKTKRNLNDLLGWGQTDASPEVRERFVGLKPEQVSPKGWSMLENARGGMRSERGDESGGAPQPIGVDTGKEKQRGRPMGTVQEETRFKGKKWSEVKPENWEMMSLDEKFDELYTNLHPSKSGLREVDHRRLVNEVLKAEERAERDRSRRERRERLRNETAAAPSPAPQTSRSRDAGETESPDEPAKSWTREQSEAARKKDLDKIDRRIGRALNNANDAADIGDASDDHRDFWGQMADVAQDSDNLTMSQIESMSEMLEGFIDDMSGEELTAEESASVRTAKALLSTLEDIAGSYRNDPFIEQGDTTAAVRAGGAGEDDVATAGVNAARFLADGGMQQFRNYNPSPSVVQYADASRGMRSERAGRTQMTDEATFFKRVQDSLSREIREARSAGDDKTVRGLELLEKILRRQESGKLGDRRTNVGTLTVTADEADQILDALMFSLDRQMATGGSRVDLFSEMIERLSEAAYSTFISKETEEITSRTQSRTNSQGRQVQIPNS